ncbi:hypothetical protein EIP86_006112 [Pleurotus ostreatoroseus]|nr:hypothetical protein EIP86_006112 [Pleurotus ostreatoroseus]
MVLNTRLNRKSSHVNVVVSTASAVTYIDAGEILSQFHAKLLAKTAPVSALTYSDKPIETRRCQSRPPRLSPAVRLPSELLQEIFSIFAQLCPRRNDHVDGLRWDSWVQVTHVCRRWRSVALAFPALWTRITVVNARVARAWFHRSGELPLDVVCYVTPQDRQPSKSCEAISRAHDRLEVTMQELHRLRRLEVISTSWSRTFISSSTWLGRSAPLLESLILDVRASPAARCEFNISTLTLFQASNLAQLKFLCLKDETHLWGAPLPRSLRALEVAHAHLLVWKKDQWAFNTSLLNALSTVPKLEELIIVDDVTHASTTGRPTTFPDLPAITLPHLRTLTIRNAHPLPSLYLLDHIILASTTKIRLDLLSDDDLDVPVITPLLARLLSGHVAGDCTPARHPCDLYEIRTVRLECNTDFHLVGWTEDITSSSADPSLPPPRIDIHFALPQTSSPPSSSSCPALPTDLQRLYWSVLTEDILEDIHFPHTAALHLGPLAPYTLLTDFRRVLAGFDKLSALYVDGWTTRQLLALLHTTQSFSAELFLPNLRILVLRGVHFPPQLLSTPSSLLETSNYTSMSAGVDSRWQLSLLASRLAQRRNRGHALHVLVLSRCFNLVATDVALLRDVVNTLHWDGNEHVGEADVWREEVPYGVRYPWEGVGDQTSDVSGEEGL